MLSGTFSEVTYSGRIKCYPDGSRELMACSKPWFRAPGWEAREPRSRRRPKQAQGGGDVARAVRRARAQVRDLALCNPFTHFVTLTLDQSRVDRYDMAAITRKLNAWLSNQVQRRGLIYVLVPERHKDGAIHFHGFFNDVLDRVDSGTMIPPEGGKPRKPRSKAQRAAWEAEGGRVVWNLPGWSLGFTTALELVGDYSRAVGYVCKYIGKQQDPGDSCGRGSAGDEAPVSPDKPGGRWYYSGGDLARPVVELADLDPWELRAQPGARVIEVPEAGAVFVVWWDRGEKSPVYRTGQEAGAPPEKRPFDNFRKVKQTP